MTDESKKGQTFSGVEMRDLTPADLARVRYIVDEADARQQLVGEMPLGTAIRATLEGLVMALIATEPCLCQPMGDCKSAVGCPVHGRPR